MIRRNYYEMSSSLLFLHWHTGWMPFALYVSMRANHHRARRNHNTASIELACPQALVYLDNNRNVPYPGQ